MSGNSKTVLEVLQSTQAYFAKYEVENPRLNAEHLVAHVLGKKRIELYLEFDRPLFEAQLAPLRELVRDRAQGRPLQHLLGTVDFHGRIFKSDARALIPRPETEQLVELLISDFGFRISERKNAVADADAPISTGAEASPLSAILDVGTGSGVIALTLAAEFENAEVAAVDLSDDALVLARENAEKLGLAGRVQFLKSDLLENVEGAFDLIVANLPYIAADAIPALSREVRFDPKLALDGGSRGTEIISRLIVSARGHFRPGGLLALEIGHDQADVLTAELQRENYQDIRCESDYQGIPRFLFAKYG